MGISLNVELSIVHGSRGHAYLLEVSKTLQAERMREHRVPMSSFLQAYFSLSLLSDVQRSISNAAANLKHIHDYPFIRPISSHTHPHQQAVKISTIT